MANLVETIQFDPVYQLETTDKPIGGSAGIANRQAIQLANRDAWLKRERDTGNFYSEVITPGGDYSISAANDPGKVIRCFGLASPTMFLPPIGDWPTGKSVTIANASQIAGTSTDVTIAAWSPDLIGGFYFGPASIAIRPGEAVVITKISGFSAWFVTNRYSIDGDYGPIGSVITLAGPNAPNGYITCNGAAISRTTYARLFNAIGTAYGVGNGTTTFNVPDLRASFVRGLDAGRGIDTGRVLGTSQADELRSHTHELNALMMTNYAPTAGIQTGMFNNAGSVNSSFVVVTGGAETRPRNVAMNFYIKF